MEIKDYKFEKSYQTYLKNINPQIENWILDNRSTNNEKTSGDMFEESLDQIRMNIKLAQNKLATLEQSETIKEQNPDLALSLDHLLLKYEDESVKKKKIDEAYERFIKESALIQSVIHGSKNSATLDHKVREIEASSRVIPESIFVKESGSREPNSPTNMVYLNLCDRDGNKINPIQLQTNIISSNRPCKNSYTKLPSEDSKCQLKRGDTCINCDEDDLEHTMAIVDI